jgi:hypothetical protein
LLLSGVNIEDYDIKKPKKTDEIVPEDIAKTNIAPIAATKLPVDKKRKLSVEETTHNVSNTAVTYGSSAVMEAKKKPKRRAPSASTMSDSPSKLPPAVAPSKRISPSVFEPVIREIFDEFWSMEIPDALVASAFFTLITRKTCAGLGIPDYFDSVMEACTLVDIQVSSYALY